MPNVLESYWVTEVRKMSTFQIYIQKPLGFKTHYDSGCPHLEHFNWIITYLQSHYFQLRSNSQILRVGTQTLWHHYSTQYTSQFSSTLCWKDIKSGFRWAEETRPENAGREVYSYTGEVFNARQQDMWQSTDFRDKESWWKKIPSPITYIYSVKQKPRLSAQSKETISENWHEVYKWHF